MLDVRTLIVVLVFNSLIIAASMAVSAEFRLREGIGKWTCSLLLQAVMWVCYGMRGDWPDVATVVVPNTLFVIGTTLQVSATIDFYGRRLNLLWHVVPPLLFAALFFAVLPNPTQQAVATGTVLGLSMLIAGIVVNRLADSRRPARWMLVVGFLAAATALLLRAIFSFVDPTALRDFLAPSPIQVFTLLVCLAVMIVTSVGFMLLHKERLEETAQRLAVTDPLTGAFNRRTFLELASKEIARSQRMQTAMSLLMLDLDHFKLINDKYGHPAGDEVLRRVVDALQTCLRREDLLVRYGGEEFSILLPNVSLDQAMLLAERARQAVEKLVITIQGRNVAVTISLGAAALRRGPEDNIKLLVARADEALYSAKKAGRNRVVAYPENSTIALLVKTHKRVEN